MQHYFRMAYKDSDHMTMIAVFHSDAYMPKLTVLAKF